MGNGQSEAIEYGITSTISLLKMFISTMSIVIYLYNGQPLLATYRDDMVTIVPPSSLSKDHEKFSSIGKKGTNQNQQPLQRILNFFKYNKIYFVRVYH